MLIVCAGCQAINRIPPERARQDPVCGTCRHPLLDGTPQHLGDIAFERFIARTELPVAVDFWAGWCGPCRTMAPHFERAAARLKGEVIFAKVDSDANPASATRYAIRSLPTIVLFTGGQEVRRISGSLQEVQILAWLDDGR